MRKLILGMTCLTAAWAGAVTCPPGEGLSDAGVCEACPAGFFQPSADGGTCLPCAPGTAVFFGGATECDVCMPGTAQAVAGQKFCAACQAGTFSDIAGSMACWTCPPNTYSMGGSSFCDACPPPQASASDCVKTVCFAGTLASEWDDSEIPPPDDDECTQDLCQDGQATYLPNATLCDAGTVDAGVSDAGASDAGVSDAGASDAGASGAGVSDAGAPDAGVAAPDAGHPSDAGLGVVVPAAPTGCGCGVPGHEGALGVFLLWTLLKTARRFRNRA